MKRYAFLALPLVIACAGCWTFGTSEYPETALVAARTNSTARAVAVIGFDASLTERLAVAGYQSYYVPTVYAGRRHHVHACYPGYYEVVPTTTFVDERRQTDFFLNRAKDILETAGYVIAAPTPTWTVEVRFDGPFSMSGEASKRALWVVGTLFFCDYSSVTWNARLKIRDNRTGELVFSQTYVQPYETKVFGLIPIFGIASCDETSSNAMQVWCLSALTDRALADATSFLSTQAQ